MSDSYIGNGDTKKFVTETRTAKELWGSIWRRFLELAVKLISVKGFCLAEATALLILGYVDSWFLLSVMGVILGVKFAEKKL